MNAPVISAHRIDMIKKLEANGDSGTGSKKAVVLAYYKDHPLESIGYIAKQLNMNYATVRFAILSLKGGAVSVAKAAKQKMVSLPKEGTSGDFDHKKSNEVDAFCPKCGKALKANIVAVELHGETYKHNASGRCACGCSFSYKVD
jgi:hypothetical protein